MKPLRVEIEAHYVNWYLTALALAWGKFIEPNGGLLSKWQIDEVPNQHRFYDRNVRPWLEGGENRRAFVIISDAFRYESAQELTTELNGKYRFGATLSSQLGVLPSYTTLGMASLLPHKTLAYKGTDVLVDGKSSIASERDGILQAVSGLACKYDELMAKKKDEGREFVKDKRVVFIYHNTVDAVGDDGKTEGHTFEAVRRAIDELAALTGYIVNNLNGHHIVVTADHGFLFTETARVETDKSKLKDKPDNAILAKKRYMIGLKLPDHDTAWHGKLSVTGGADGDMEFWIPKGANLPLCRWRSLRPWRGHAAGDRRPGHHRQAYPGQVGTGNKNQAGDGPGAGQQSPDHERLLPVPVDPDGGRQRPSETEHTQGCRL